MLPATGVLMQNRGASFSLQSGALNPLMPGRLPIHTLNPALAVLKDGRIMAYGCMGGDGQPQTQSALFTRYVTFREPLADAIDRPRWVLGRTWGAARTALRLEPRFDGNLIEALANAGHEVEVLDDLIPTSWATPARWCCTRTAAWKARTIRARMAARRGCEA